MAQALYDKMKESFLDQVPSVDFLNDTLRVIFVESGYVFSAAHQFFDELSNTRGNGGDTRADGEALVGKSAAGGVFDASDPAFASVTGTNINAFVLYKDTGVDATSPLIGYFDSIPTITPTGQAITILFNDGVNRVFKL